MLNLAVVSNISSGRNTNALAVKLDLPQANYNKSVTQMTNLPGQFSPVRAALASGIDEGDGRGKSATTAYNAVVFSTESVVPPNPCIAHTTNVRNSCTFSDIPPSPDALKGTIALAASPLAALAAPPALAHAPDIISPSSPAILSDITSILTAPHCAVDSMQLWIPVKAVSVGKRQYEKETPIKLIDCTYSEECLRDSWIQISTGEVVKEYPPYLHQDEHLSFKTGYAFRYSIIGNKRVYFISIGLHSKLLGTDYFKSINKQTIYTVWEAIQEQGVINISFENFMQCYVHQIDLKTDAVQDDVNAALDLIEANIKDDRSYKRYDKSFNQGIQVSSRKENQVSIHFYNKALQFLNDSSSSIFLEKVLKFTYPRNLLRTEITLYAKQFVKDFDMNNKEQFNIDSEITLANVLDEVEAQGRDVMKKYLNQILVPNKIDLITKMNNDTNEVLNEKLALNEKLSLSIKTIVQLCIGNALDLNDTERLVLQVIGAGINKKREVLKLTRHHYEVQTNDMDINAEIKDILNV